MLIKEEATKVNFIDKNDLFVGYDTNQGCCEHAGWFVSNQQEKFTYDIEEGIRGYNLEDYHFKPVTVERVEDTDKYPSLDEGDMVIFTLINDAGDILYLHIFNSHNGYYGHEVLTNVPNVDSSIYL